VSEDAGVVGIAVEAAQPSGAAVGCVDEASDRALIGARVLVPALDACGECDVCRRGGAAVCPLARPRVVFDSAGPRTRAAARWLVALGDGLELPVPAAAAVAGDVALAYTLYARANLAPRDPAIVLGATPIARFLVQILVAKSITPTVVAGARDGDAWRAWLGRAGAAIADDGDPRATVADALAAQGLGTRPLRLLVTDPDALPRAAALAGPRATIAAIAPPDRPLPALDGALLAREVTAVGVAGVHPDLIIEAAALCARGDIDLADGVVVAPPNDHATDPTKAIVNVYFARK
jgi:D-arabinose 1-dehydrogenase-like Zn-dependent alcohol dehydrogenase